MAQQAVRKKSEPKQPVEPVNIIVEEAEPSIGIIAVDNGGFNTKILTQDMDKPVIMSSKKGFGSSYDPFGTAKYPDGTYRVSWNNKTYFFGLLLNSTRRHLSSFTPTKSTDYFVLSILMGTALYGYDINYLITTTPYSRYSEEEMSLIIGRLIGDHEININGSIYKFKIEECYVAPEAIIASYAIKPWGKHRWVDLGSRTVGFGTTFGDQDTGFFYPIWDECDTIEKEGLDIRSVLDKEQDELKEYVKEYIENIYNELSPFFDDNDPMTIFGGGALVPEIAEEMKVRFPNMDVAEDPLTIQVRGLMEYALTSDVYGSDEEYVEEE
ncbi:ParM/StbA family protein [Paenibacillus sp. Mc5Re-14]|uniref:ParM/StbA family protein n=1 Tax=Paenibacillus sp. Mc5Re-14 TaxID=1030529 RepID=UPI000AE76188|nr:hypothetical protein [Paenibacillus sp. Mc5Re-14]